MGKPVTNYGRVVGDAIHERDGGWDRPSFSGIGDGEDDGFVPIAISRVWDKWRKKCPHGSAKDTNRQWDKYLKTHFKAELQALKGEA